MNKKCVNRKDLLSIVKLIRNSEIETEAEKRTRVNIWDITPKEITAMVESLDPSDLVDGGKVPSQKIASLLENNLLGIKAKHKPAVKRLTELLKTPNNEADTDVSLRHQGMALNFVMETVKGEVDKIKKYNVDSASVTDSNGIPYVPLHRLAATIGRRMLYAQGRRIHKSDTEGKNKAAAVELAYYRFGMTALRDLEANGFVSLVEAGKQNVIMDWVEEGEANFDWSQKVTTEAPSLKLELDNLGGKSVAGSFNGKPTKDSQAREEGELGAVRKVLRAISLVSVPQNSELPATKPSDLRQKTPNVYKPGKTVAEAKNLMESRPNYLQEDVHGLFSLIFKDLNGQSTGSKYLRDVIRDDTALKRLFGVESENQVVSDSDSFRGRNLAKTTPIDDLLADFDYFDGYKPAELYMAMFAGRNSRQYMDNTVINPHSSKVMRHALATEEYSLDVNSDAYKYFVNKLADVLGANKSDKSAFIDGMLNDAETSESELVTNLVSLHNEYVNADTAPGKLKVVARMSDLVPHLDFSELITSARALTDVRNSLSTGKLTTTYTVASDATASGALLTFIQALGRNSSVKELMQKMSVFKGKEPKSENVDDVYALLGKGLETIAEKGWGNGDNLHNISDTDEKSKVLNTLQLLLKSSYKNVRELSKSPTMTFVYGQGEVGAITSMSSDISERLIKSLNTKKKISPELQETMDSVLGVAYKPEMLKESTFKTELEQKIAATELPKFLYNSLTTAVTNRYLKEHNNASEDIISFINKYADINEIKMLPAGTVLDMSKDGEAAVPTKAMLEESGVPLTKRGWQAKTVDGDVVLTVKELLAKSVLNVSSIHSADTASMFHSLANVMKKYDNAGAVVIHDEARGRADMLMDFDQEYINQTLNVGMDFDIHEQALLAVAAYNPKLLEKGSKGNAKYTKLLKEVREAKQRKRELLQDKDNGFDIETSRVIGDRDSFIDFTAEVASKPEKDNNSTAAKTETGTKPSVKSLLEELAPKSELIRGFLDSENSAILSEGEASFDPKTDTVKVPKDANIENVEHEIVHSYTTALIQQWVNAGGKGNEDLSYIGNTIKKLRSVRDTLKGESLARVDYILRQPTKSSQLSEFISVMSTEPAVAKDVYKAFKSGTTESKLRTVIKRVTDGVRKAIRAVDSKAAYSLKDGSVDPQVLFNAINDVLITGQLQRELNVEMVKDLQEEFGTPLYFNGPIEVVNDSMDYLNRSASRFVLGSADYAGGKLKAADYLLRSLPAYSSVANRAKGIYDGSEALQSVMHKITNGNINQLKKNEILSIFNKVESDKNEITSQQLQRFKAAQRNMSKEQKNAFYDFTQKMSITDYFLYADGVKDIESEIDSAKNDLDFHLNKLSKLDDLVDFNTNPEYVAGKGTTYNIEAAGFKTGEVSEAARKYVVLRSIQKLGVERFEGLLEQKELMGVLRDVSLANSAVLNQHKNIKTDQLRDNNLVEEFEGNPTFRAVRPEDWKYYDEGQNGWKVLRKPGKGGVGVVYQRTIDSTFQSGAFTTISTTSSDIDVNSDMKSYRDVVPTKNGFKVVLSQKEKEDAGLIKNPAQSIVRALTHNMAIQDSAVIRDKLLEEDTYFDIKGDSEQELIDRLKDDSLENPWLLGADSDLNYESLPKEIKAKYMRVPTNLSNVDGFNTKIQLVRKDISYWLVGASEGSIVRDPKLQMGIRIAKNLITGAKIGMVVLNPVKIFKDNVFNVVYLSTLGVDPVTMQRSYREISTEFNEYQNLKNKMNMLRIRSYADPDKFKNQLQAIEDKMETHPARGLVERGFINSLGSDIIMNGDDPGSGYKSGIDTVLKKIFTDNEGKNNAIGRFIMRVANTPVGVEGVLESMGNVFSHAKSTKELESELNSMAKNIANVKSDEDIVAYMHQFLNSPNSEFVKLGSHLTDLTDVLAKETYYRHLVSKGGGTKKELEKAEIDVISAFPDYKEGLPTKVQQLDQMGILMFPQYWMRMIQAMLRLAGHRPVSFGTEVGISNMVGANSQMWEQTLIYKANSRWGLVHEPWDHIGVGSVVPTNIL